jgi:hypothetical protein
MGFTGRRISVISVGKHRSKRIGILATEEAIQKAREKSLAIAVRKAARRAKRSQQ